LVCWELTLTMGCKLHCPPYTWSLSPLWRTPFLTFHTWQMASLRDLLLTEWHKFHSLLVGMIPSLSDSQRGNKSQPSVTGVSNCLEPWNTIPTVL
jgi:hypothetical protein